jgi:hypothetical protein
MPAIVVRSTAMEDWARDGRVGEEDREAWEGADVDGEIQVMFAEMVGEEV